MKVEYINPFIESVYGLCSTMLKCQVQRGDLALANNSPVGGDITGIIGLSGPARGTVALSFPMTTARAMVRRLLHSDERDVEETLPDGVAELVNIVAGAAKSKFCHEEGTPLINLSLPTVVQGRDYKIDYPVQSAWLDVPFNTELGPFKLRVTFEFAKKGARA